jgi:hypothetical protein
MSFSFDKAQEALEKLRVAKNITPNQAELIGFLQRFVDELHEESHKRRDELNRGRVADVASDIDILLRAQAEGKSYFEKWKELNP